MRDGNRLSGCGAGVKILSECDAVVVEDGCAEIRVSGGVTMKFVHEAADLRLAVSTEFVFGAGEVWSLVLDLPADDEHLFSENKIGSEAQQDEPREGGIQEGAKIQGLLAQLLKRGVLHRGSRGSGARSEQLLLVRLRFDRVHAIGWAARRAVELRAAELRAPELRAF